MFEPRIRGRRMRPLWLATVATVLTLVAACGGTATQPSSGTTSLAPVAPLVVVIGAYTPAYTDLFIAQEQGFWKKAGVDVTLTNAGTQITATFLAGRGDLLVGGGAFGFPYVEQGKNLKLVYTTNYGTVNGFAVKSDSKYTNALSLGGASVATYGVSESIGLPKALSNYIVSKGGKPLNLLSLANSTGDLASFVAGGGADTTIVSTGVAAPYLSAGKLRWATGLEPQSDLIRQLEPLTTPGPSFWGFQDTLTQKKESIIRLIAGLRMAERWLAKQSDATVAKELHTVEGFSVQTEAQVLSGVQTSRPNWAIKQEGFLSASDWKASLTGVWTNWNIPVDLTSPKFSYSNLVDMSYWNASTKTL